MGSIFSQDKRTFIRSTFAGAGVSVLAAVLDQVLLFLQRRVEAQLRENLSANLLRAPAHPLCAPLCAAAHSAPGPPFSAKCGIEWRCALASHTQHQEPHSG